MVRDAGQIKGEANYRKNKYSKRLTAEELRIMDMMFTACLDQATVETRIAIFGSYPMVYKAIAFKVKIRNAMTKYAPKDE